MSYIDIAKLKVTVFLSNLDGNSYSRFLALLPDAIPSDMPNAAVGDRVLRLVAFAEGAAGCGWGVVFQAIHECFPSGDAPQLREALIATTSYKFASLLSDTSPTLRQSAFQKIVGITPTLQTPPVPYEADTFVVECLDRLLDIRQAHVVERTRKFLAELASSLDLTVSQKIEILLEKHATIFLNLQWTEVLRISDVAVAEGTPVLSLVVRRRDTFLADASEHTTIVTRLYGYTWSRENGPLEWHVFSGAGTTELEQVSNITELRDWVRTYLLGAIRWVESDSTALARVEFFLPNELMDLAVDEWQLPRSPGSSLTLLGKFRQVVVRMADRFEYSPADFRRSKGLVCTHLRKTPSRSVRFANMPGDPYDALNEFPQPNWFICEYPTEEHGTEFWSGVLDSNVPCGLWHRTPPQPEDLDYNVQAIDHIPAFINAKRRVINPRFRLGLYCEQEIWPPVEFSQQDSASLVR